MFQNGRGFSRFIKISEIMMILITFQTITKQHHCITLDRYLSHRGRHKTVDDGVPLDPFLRDANFVFFLSQPAAGAWKQKEARRGDKIGWCVKTTS